MSGVEIQLTQGLVALIDEEDAAFVMQWKWCVRRDSQTFYVIRNHPASGVRGRHTVLLHRELLQAPDGMEVDHINGDGLDNRRCNLRLATHSQNMKNLRPRTGTTSRYRGVVWDKNHQRWHARIQSNGRLVHLGRFADENDAAMAYDEAARLHHSEFARLNFPAQAGNGGLK